VSTIRIPLTDRQASIVEVDVIDGYDPDVDEDEIALVKLEGLDLVLPDKALEALISRVCDIGNDYDDDAEKAKPGEKAEPRGWATAAYGVHDKLCKHRPWGHRGW